MVLIHGIGARSHYGPIHYFFGLPGLLSRERIRHISVRLSPWKNFMQRAIELREQIVAHFPEGKLNLIGHSMGGLDARYLISQLDFGDRIESLTTIGTPHRGTPLATMALLPVGSRRRTWARRFFSTLGYPIEALDCLTPDFCQRELVALTPPDPRVAYYSMTSAIPAREIAKKSLPLFWLSNRWIRKIDGENDGMISVNSARYGESLAVFPGDHYGQIGQLLGRSRGLDYPELYRMILRKLQLRGH